MCFNKEAAAAAAMAAFTEGKGMESGKVLGVTVLPEWIQAEGSNAILDRLQAAGVTGVATSPYVMQPVEDGAGSREPPVDAGAGSVRLLDRELWGRRELWVQSAPSFVADRSLYDGLTYQPAAPTELTRREGPLVAAFIEAAKKRGMQVHLQVQSAIPPGYRVQFGGPGDEDEPLLPDGSRLDRRVDRNGSLASPQIRAYACALIMDLSQAYPDVDAIRLDWPEYPPYSLDALFFDFSAHALGVARELGLDDERMRRDALAVRAALGAGAGEEVGISTASLWRLAIRHPGVADLFWLKRQLVSRFLSECREALASRIDLVAQAFPPPWSALSGFDYGDAGRHVAAIGCKLYTMHWPMMLRAYGDTLLKENPKLSSRSLAMRLVELFATGDPAPDSMEDLEYPEPDEAHPCGSEALAAKLASAQAEAGPCPVLAFAHAYGPKADVERRLRAAWDGAASGVWINRYGYMANDKFEMLAQLPR